MYILFSVGMRAFFRWHNDANFVNEKESGKFIRANDHVIETSHTHTRSKETYVRFLIHVKKTIKYTFYSKNYYYNIVMMIPLI